MVFRGSTARSDYLQLSNFSHSAYSPLCWNNFGFICRYLMWQALIDLCHRLPRVIRYISSFGLLLAWNPSSISVTDILAQISGCASFSRPTITECQIVCCEHFRTLTIFRFPHVWRSGDSRLIAMGRGAGLNTDCTFSSAVTSDEVIYHAFIWWYWSI